jgi:hypothetical protein
MMPQLSQERIGDIQQDLKAYYDVLKKQLDKAAKYDALTDTLLFDMVLADAADDLTPETMDKNKFYVQVVQDNNQAILVSYLELPSNEKKTSRYTARQLDMTQFSVPFDLHAIKEHKNFKSPTPVRNLFQWISNEFEKETKAFQAKLADGSATDEDLEQYKVASHALLNEPTVVKEIQIYRQYAYSGTYDASNLFPEDGRKYHYSGSDGSVGAIRAWKAFINFVDWVMQGFPKVHKPKPSLFRPATKTEQMIAEFLEKTDVLGGASKDVAEETKGNELFDPTTPLLVVEASAPGEVYYQDGTPVPPLSDPYSKT